MFTRTHDAPGLGRLTRSWLSRTWRGQTNGVALRLGDVTPETLARTQRLLEQDQQPAIAALRALAVEAEQPAEGNPTLERLDVRPDGALAVYTVPWDEEHAWGVELDPGGGVQGVVVSPGP